jgi:hypothetical protein
MNPYRTPGEISDTELLHNRSVRYGTAEWLRHVAREHIRWALFVDPVHYWVWR